MGCLSTFLITTVLHCLEFPALIRILFPFQGLSKWFGKGMHEFAAKIDEYARGMIGPHGATLFEELGLYYIGPIDGNNIDDLICVLKEVSTLDSTGPVLVHVITENEKDSGGEFNSEITPDEEGVQLQIVNEIFCNPMNMIAYILLSLFSHFTFWMSCFDISTER